MDDDYFKVDGDNFEVGGVKWSLGQWSEGLGGKIIRPWPLII